MRKTGISLILILTIFLFTCPPATSMAEDTIKVMNYQLKPIGYVDSNKFIQTVYNIELKNNDGSAHSFNLKIVFMDKSNNSIKESKKKLELQANETKVFTDAILLEPELAKQISNTKGVIENLQ